MTLGDGLLDSLAAVGATGRGSARFWVRAERAGELELGLKGSADEHRGAFTVSVTPETDSTTSVLYPDDFSGGRPLTPGAPYRWAIRRTDDGTFLGEGKLETSPDSEESAPDQLSFAVMSGHQPFDDRGALRPDSLGMLRAAALAFEQHHVKRVLMVGGQIHTTQPERCSVFDPSFFRKVGPRSRPSLFDCTRQEVRRVFHERYRAHWAVPELQKIMQRWPCHPMLADSDLFDDFGGRIEHASSVWSSVREGALDSAFDHQALFVRGREGARPSSYHFQLEYGPIAAFMMDVRSHRGWFNGHHQIYSEEQLGELSAFLAANERRPVMLLGTSVPLGAGWDDPLARPDRDRLLRVLGDHQQRCPTQKLIVISSDAHGAIQRIHWDGPAHQLVAGPISRDATRLLRTREASDVRLGGTRIETVHRPGMRNPYDRTSIGLVKLERSQAEWKVRLMLIGQERDQPKTVFETEI